MQSSSIRGRPDTISLQLMYVAQKANSLTQNQWRKFDSAEALAQLVDCQLQVQALPKQCLSHRLAVEVALPQELLSSLNYPLSFLELGDPRDPLALGPLSMTAD